MKITDLSFKNPYAVLSLALIVGALGTFAFFRTPTDLFPETAPPQVVVLTVQPGASASDIADRVTEPIERELRGLVGVDTITSTSRDEASSIRISFSYDLTIGQAVTEVQNGLARVRPSLPAGIREPSVFRITEATRPLVTIALSPAEGSRKSLAEIRVLADNHISTELLKIDGVADVDVFGGHVSEVSVRLRRDSMAAHGVSGTEVLQALAAVNVSAPIGTIEGRRSEYLAKVSGEFGTVDEIGDAPIRHSPGGTIRVRDVATVEVAGSARRSIYHGNGRPAIAVNVLRQEGIATTRAVESVKARLPSIEARFTDIRFELTDDQEPLIDINVNGMRISLIQAVILTVLVILVFLADARAAAVVAISIPLSFLVSLTVLWFSPYTMNMVTISGFIIAVGMVVDASVVVLENIYRHFKSSGSSDPQSAARAGTSEVSLAILAGMLTTVVVLFPVMFAGGYTERVMRPLALVIISTLVGSLVVALTVLPLLAARALKSGARQPNALERLLGHTGRAVDALTRVYVGILRRALAHRAATLVLALAFLVATVKVVMPLIGGELMPPMDTGIAVIEFDTASDASVDQVEETLTRVEHMLYAQPGVLKVSSVVGSEPGAISFGGGGATVQAAVMTVHMVDRTKRDRTIWEIQDEWRSALRTIDGVRSFRVSEYGATPRATTKAPLDIIISGPEPETLARLADETVEALRGTPGLVDVRPTWRLDRVEQHVVVDADVARAFGTSPMQASRELKLAVHGGVASTFALVGYSDMPIVVRYADDDMAGPRDLMAAYVSTARGQVPLRAIARIEERLRQPFVTRENLGNTIDVTGVNRIYTIGQVASLVNDRLAELRAPDGYSIRVAGTAADMEAGRSEMGGAILLGLVLLYILLVSMFKSFGHPITIISAIPLAVAGAMWGLLLFNKSLSQSASMGMILLGGTIVNNSILLLDFILNARARGVEKEQAILDSVRLRIRPILMTTVSTIIGLGPLVLETAVGLERMSPLGIVAATGLAVGTILTIVLVPVVYSVFDSIAARVRGGTQG